MILNKRSVQWIRAVFYLIIVNNTHWSNASGHCDHVSIQSNSAYKSGPHSWYPDQVLFSSLYGAKMKKSLKSPF